MTATVCRICALLSLVVSSVRVGTNLDLLLLMLTFLSGRLLLTRGAVTSALSDAGLEAGEVRRAVAALAYGRFEFAKLLEAWQRAVVSEGQFEPSLYEGYRPVACDLVGFFRARLSGCATKHFASQAGKALPAVVFALAAAVGRVGSMRFALLRHVLAQEPADRNEEDLMRRAIVKVRAGMAPDEVLVVDAGFGLADLLASGAKIVVRVARNFTARRNFLPAYLGRGCRPKYGERVRPRSRKRGRRSTVGTRPDQVTRFKSRGRFVRVQIFENLVMAGQKPGAPSFRCAVLHDPKYREPLVLVTNLPVSPKALLALYRDRWPIEHPPLAAKQMLGAERAFVHGEQSRIRLPQLALLCGNILAYVAAVSQPVATGFWDRCARPTCGRLRRTLQRVHFSELPIHRRRLRKKASPTDHLTKGFLGHNRHWDRVLTGN